ncbi:sodium, potassium, lithium and rubidium/H(+) antiporter [Paenibacillus marchantiophytorum]|uniref:Sodium, potassium, lithium and rubidium/H(+) antiporter n=1 Tax=Paenibacillus marchantiophytorum TaxID=1619310 RepID=A0ABQ1EWU4_9BACL|nr:Na+/H+ antiporter [Paenibacillus marchantiophytorum]GFZ89007.1 sodium, potassium, lithium and rubidium/H(+) antiporter [Paenibacillus marchantiophytorum]
MEVFIIILMLLVLIGVSNVVHRFVPFIPIPLIQIALGASLVMVPLGIHLHLEPELFFILFIAPLLYNDGKHTPRDELWRLRAPILLLAVGLVFITVLVVGYSVHWMIPSIPLAAAFGLAAILSPTDAVAVGSLAGRIHLPRSLKRLLEGEALMNDASGLVAFKFAIAAAVTGVFSFPKASLSFFVISIGGLIIGALVAFLIIGLRQLLRRAGLEDETMHMLLQILTPFLLYLIAEELGVSGILAAVAGGLVHAIENERMAFTMPNLKNVSNPTWSVILFVLNGLVFVLLGLQIPGVSNTILIDPTFNNYRVIGYAILIYAMLLVLRFGWTFLFSRGGRWFGNQSKEVPSLRILMLTAISGVRGAVTLAGAFSIPLLLQNGEPFPQRDLILFLASSVILLSLLTASIVLPLLAKKKSTADDAEKERIEREWQIEVMTAAVKALQGSSNEKNEFAVTTVISDYKIMMQQLGQKDSKVKRLPRYQQEQAGMRLMALGIERKYVNDQLESGQVSRDQANYYLQMLEQVELILANKLDLGKAIMKTLWRRLKMLLIIRKPSIANGFIEPDMAALRTLKMQCSQAVVDEFSRRCTIQSDEATEGVLDYYQQMLERLRRFTMGSRRKDRSFEDCRRELHWIAIQAERDAVQVFFERGDITRDLAALLRRVIRNREASLYELEEIG